MSFAFGLFAGCMAGAVAALPAALLRSDAPAGTWLALAGASALALGPALGGVVVSRPLPVALRVALAALGLSVLPLAWFGARLQVGTHHRPLGAVTFAVGAAAVVFATGLVAARWVSWSGSERRSVEAARWGGRVLALVALLGPAWLALRLFSSAEARRALFDVALCLAVGALLLWRTGPVLRDRLGSRVGAAAWLVVVLVGVVAALGPAGTAAQVASPALFAPIGWALR